MMISLLYDLIFTLPLLPIIYSLATRVYMPHNSVIAWMCVAIEAVIFLAVYLRRKWKLLAIIPTVIIVFAIGVNYTLFIIVAVAILAFGIGFFTKKYPIVNYVVALGIIAYFVICMVNKIDLPIMVVICGFIVVLTALFTIVDPKWRIKGLSGNKKYLVAVVPFIIIPSLFTLAFPKPDTPYDWAFFVNIYNNIVSSIDSTFNSLEFDKDVGVYSGVGFSTEGDFGGNLVTSDKEMMRISLDKRYAGKLYLTGKVFDSFEDMRWVVNNPSDAQDVALDTYETVEAARLLGEGKISDYLSTNRVRFDYTYTRSEYVFAPTMSIPYSSDLDSLGVRQADGGLRFDSKKGHGTKYYIDFYEINQDVKYRDKLVNSKNVIDEEVWKLDNFSGKGGSSVGLTYQDLLSHRANIYNTYTTKPVLSDRMKSYLEELFAGCDTAQEKLDRLQDTLQDYNYTMKPGPMPDWVKNETDFLDYFCLDSKEGYCSYFATAFALIARYEGIPTRYIQGYVVPQNKSEIIVTRNMAHAWPEAYYENVGWIAYEPTPGYEISTTWKKYDPNKASSHSTYGGPTDNKTETVEEDTELIEKNESSALPQINIGVIIGLVVLAIVIFILLDIIILRIKWNRLPDKDKLISICHKAIYVLKKCGYNYSDRMTIREFKSEVLEGEIFTTAELDILDIYEKISYCDSAEIALEDGEKSYKAIMAIARKNMSTYRYISMKIWLLSR